ncbi:hypothetical protein SGPA1_30360 [Streptomyces misionensis JCM 4497]
MVLVRGQLRVVREEQGRAARPGRGPSAPGDVQEADPGLIGLAPRLRVPDALVRHGRLRPCQQRGLRPLPGRGPDQLPVPSGQGVPAGLRGGAP